MNRFVRTTSRRQAGFSLVEVIVSTLLTGLIIVGSMKCFSQVVSAREVTSEFVHGEELANDLMAEILSTDYLEPEGTPGFGMESGESTGNRSKFDDVDDFHNWKASPPQDARGIALPKLAGWERRVVVEYVAPDDVNRVVSADQGIKRITIIISKDGVEFARSVAFRSNKFIQQ